MQKIWEPRGTTFVKFRDNLGLRLRYRVCEKERVWEQKKRAREIDERRNDKNEGTLSTISLHNEIHYLLKNFVETIQRSIGVPVIASND